MELLHRLAHLDPRLIWGVTSRGIGLVFFVSFASLSWQVLPFAGSRGVMPIRDALGAIREHFPTWKRFFYFPSLLWIHSSDAFLRSLPWLGMIASASTIVGGPHAPLAFLVCYLAYLSLDRPMVLIYPWDCLLFEAGFWAMFLPATHVLPDPTAVAAPIPAVVWVFRLLVFRVMLGFGKNKFLGTTRHDRGFLKGFFINQPLPTPIGWFAAKLPIWVHRLALALMFVVEVPMTFLVFAPGPWSVFAALSFSALMLAIALTGNFGHFNLAMIVLCLSWLDTENARLAVEGPLAVNLLALLHTACAVLSFPFNTFCAQVWMLWPVWSRVRPRFLVWPVVLIRALHPLRWVHAYGVFPPRSPPPVKVFPVIEVTWDEVTWHALVHPHAPTTETSKPTFCAPHHNRFDQAVGYEALGLNEASVMRNVIGRFDPYGYGGIPGPLMLLHRIVEGTVPEHAFYDRSLERARGAPVAARARTYMFEATSLQERKATGKWWRRTLVGPHFPPVKRGEGYWEHPFPPPELWHFDDLVWLRRSHLGRLMTRAARGDDVHELALTAAGELGRGDVEDFWLNFLREARTDQRHDWTNVAETVEHLRARYGRSRLYLFERLLGRYGVFLFTKLEPLFLEAGIWPIFGRRRAALDVKTTYHLRLLCQHIVAEGREVYERVLEEPTMAGRYLEEMTMQSGHYFQVIFRYEAMIFQAQKLRLLDDYQSHQGRPEPSQKRQKDLERLVDMARRTFGSLEGGEFLGTQLKTEGAALDTKEQWPRFDLRPNGEVTLAAYPPPESEKRAFDALFRV